ncbi:thioesterase-like superfamily-domain-containing protein [Aspergillus alliaceus]|uniref:Thioesterase-like superfamily-domain-containing protein n=1 Tax=Petromyces alliaceus TaxID=209559 RepID=A0A5N7C2J9_PETAA|nr:thioesterase-like superfamily-domain-containing protein [Aspergillus alliaceus]KAB8233482.1 thioesterase-like superfamily-domain-containing protein [Aspergillus alliaceus]KAE8388310.1 thioesterase-like superfamily-domain-containing protein [Aspergillus alliaceus]
MASPPIPASPLLEAVSSITLEKGTRDRFVANISPEWCTQHSVLGGYLNALILSATQKFNALEFGEERFLDPIHVFVQFLQLVPPGQVIVTCKRLRVSSRQCVVSVEVARAAVSGNPSTTATLGIVTCANLSEEEGLTQHSKPAFAVPLPNRHTECVKIDDPVVDSTPVTSKLNWISPKSTNGLWGHRVGGHHREVWVSFRDGSRISDLLHLAMLSDMPLQPAATHQAGFYFKYALSTLCMTVEFKKRPGPSTQWVMIRSNSHMVSNGRYDVNIQIFNEGGDLLALSNHVVYVSELRARVRGAKL